MSVQIEKPKKLVRENPTRTMKRWWKKMNNDNDLRFLRYEEKHVRK